MNRLRKEAQRVYQQEWMGDGHSIFVRIDDVKESDRLSKGSLR